MIPDEAKSITKMKKGQENNFPRPFKYVDYNLLNQSPKAAK